MQFTGDLSGLLRHIGRLRPAVTIVRDLENIAMPMSVWYARIVDDPESLIPANMYRGQSMPLYGRVASGYGPDNPYDPTPIIGEDARRTKMLDRLGLGDR